MKLGMAMSRDLFGVLPVGRFDTVDYKIPEIVSKPAICIFLGQRADFVEDHYLYGRQAYGKYSNVWLMGLLSCNMESTVHIRLPIMWLPLRTRRRVGNL
jgi:hypothetical protein